MKPTGLMFYGRQIGRKPDNGQFYAVTCKDCGCEVWVDKYKMLRPQYTGLCRECSHRARSGKGNSWWKGGRYTHVSGYIHVLVPKGDFFRPMADPNGYVREHRLVMARHLGRCLHRWENVHHKDGNKSNNALENLELTLNGQHTRDHSRGYKDGFRKGLQDGKGEVRRKMVAWLDGECPCVIEGRLKSFRCSRRKCPTCWDIFVAAGKE